MRKRMLKSRLDESDTLFKNNKRSTLINHQLKFFVIAILLKNKITDESSEFSNESDEFQYNQ